MDIIFLAVAIHIRVVLNGGSKTMVGINVFFIVVVIAAISGVVGLCCKKR